MQVSHDDRHLSGSAAGINVSKREFFVHAAVFLAVNAFLVALWLLASDGGFFWPLWVLLSWGIGLVVHAYQVEPDR